MITRLNKDIRAQIVSNAVAASPVPAAKKAIAKRSAEFSEHVRLDSIGGQKVDEALKAIQKEIKMLVERRGIPENLRPDVRFTSSSYVCANFGGEDRTLYLNGSMTRSNRGHSSQIIGINETIGQKFGRSDRVSYPADHHFTKEFREIFDEGVRVTELEENIRRQVAATVASFNTVKKLIEHWPEAAAIIPKSEEVQSKPTALSVQISGLNDLIGLPK